MKYALAVSLPLFAACAADPGSPYGDGLGTPENPVPAQSEEGPYQVVTRIDFTVEQVLPGQAEAIVATLRDFSKNPAHSIITLAQKEGVPAIAELYAALPGPLKDRFEGWVNDYVDNVSVGGKKLTVWAGDVATLAEHALTKFDLDSTLAIDGTKSTHALTAVDFSPTGLTDKQIAITGVAQDVLTQHPSIAIAPGGALTVGDQAFGLLLGDYAWTAINDYTTTKFGGDVRTTIGNAVNCPGLAHSVASKCVLNVCVGHETQIKAVCEGGLDALVTALHNGFKKYNFGAHYASGAATLVDTDGDGIADQIKDGTWNAQLNLGLGPRPAPASWSGTRPASGDGIQ
jgi:hypothetical protein